MDITAIEKQLVYIMENVLQIEVERFDRFIELESWQLPVLHAEIEEAFPCKLNTTDLFALPDLRSLASFIKDRINSPSLVTLAPEYVSPSTPAGAAPSVRTCHSAIHPGNTEWLKNISRRYGTDSYMLYLSIALSSLSEYFGIQYVSMEAIIINRHAVQTVRLNNEEARDDNERLAYVQRQLHSRENRVYEIKHLEKMKITKGKTDIIPCFFISSLIEVTSSLFEFFDFMVGVDDHDTSLSIDIFYNANRIRESHIEALLGLFKDQLVLRAISASRT